MAHSSGRKSKRQKPDPNQLIIPFDKSEDIRVTLNSIDHQVVGTGPNLMAQVREVVMAVWLCGRKNGCRARRATLLRVANSNQRSGTPAIGSLAALKRALKEAARLGIITSYRSSGPSERRIDEYRIKQLVELSRAPKRRPSGEPSVSRQCATGEPSVSHQCSIGEPSPLLYPNLQTSKPIKSSETSSSSTEQWCEVEEEVFSCGVNDAKQAVSTARAHGATPEQVREAVDWWRPRRDAWDQPEVVLWRRLHRWSRSIPIDEGWDRTRPGWVDASRVAANQAAHAARRAAADAERAAAAEERRRQLALETELGDELELLRDAELTQLMQEAAAGSAALLAFYRKKGRSNFAVRNDLLAALDKRSAQP